MEQQPYQIIAHTGDLAIRVFGRDNAELFCHAAQALFAVMAAPPSATTATRDINIASFDYESLLVDWLNELILLHETEWVTFNEFTIVSLTPTHLTAHVSGGPTVEKFLVVKAATFHNLHLEKSPEGVETTIVFDI